jgi:hypothetical protein
MRALSPVIVGSLALGVLGTVSRACSEPGNKTLSEIVAAQSRYPQQIRSLQVQFHAENHLTPEYLQVLEQERASLPGSTRSPHPAADQQWEIAYACRGDKFLWEEKPQDPAHESWSVRFCDGKDVYILVYIPSPPTNKPKITSVTKREGVWITYPHVLSFGYQLNSQLPREESRKVLWIGNVLREGEYRLTGTETDPQFGTLYRVQGPWRDDEATFWFARQYGWVAVRTELRSKDGKGRAVFRITKLQQAGGLWFARSAVRELFGPTSEALKTRYTIDVSSLKLNAAPDALFRFDLPAGAN